MSIDFDSLPHPADKRIALHITATAERALRGGHPWLFDGAIRKQSHEGNAGDLAVIFDQARRFLAIGLYDPESPIRVKILHHHTPAQIDRDFFRQRIEAAVTLRAPLAATDTSGYRLIHGENDGLPGFIADRYDDVLVVKLYSTAWLPYLRDMLPLLNDIVQPTGIVLRLSREMARGNTHGLYDGQVVMGEVPPMPLTFRENGLNFSADVMAGHKTGFFFDQRENRQRVRDLAKSLNRSRRVLDVFAYSGGFSVYAAAGGAAMVHSLDISAPALKAAQRNMALNAQIDSIAAVQHEIQVADAFDGLDTLDEQGQRFEMIVIDPPSFAKRADDIPRAHRAYADLVQLALPLLDPGGVLVLGSCSSRVDAESFFRVVTQAARTVHRPLAEIARTAHALDHPIGYPEGAYLKCLFARA